MQVIEIILIVFLTTAGDDLVSFEMHEFSNYATEQKVAGGLTCQQYVDRLRKKTLFNRPMKAGLTYQVGCVNPAKFATFDAVLAKARTWPDHTVTAAKVTRKDIVGTWHDQIEMGGSTFAFKKNGKCTVTDDHSDRSVTCRWKLERSRFTIIYKQERGVYYVSREGGKIQLVPLLKKGEPPGEQEMNTLMRIKDMR